MELIIKSTGVCNFNCTFCSAANMNIIHNPTTPHEKIIDLILRLKPNHIIFTGGDPLCVEPEYYYKIFEVYPCRMSATSNLKSFFLDPEKWAPLLSEDWFWIATSFQYGDGRRWSEDTIYDEKLFREVMNMYMHYTNKPCPSFISVIDENNEDRYLDHVLLAKELDTIVRLNNMLAIGKSDVGYPKYKLYRMLIDIIDKGLERYETNCRERHVSKCPRNVYFSCRKNIRACYVDKQENLHVGICDDNLALGNEFTEEEIDGNVKNVSTDEYINEKCVYCELCRLCNGCQLNRIEAKKDPNYCDEMKKLEDDLIRTNWML